MTSAVHWQAAGKIPPAILHLQSGHGTATSLMDYVWTLIDDRLCISYRGYFGYGSSGSHVGEGAKEESGAFGEEACGRHHHPAEARL
jgi:hypothetical protein